MRERDVWTKRIVLLALASSGCQSPPELYWQGEHIRFGAENPGDVCGGTLEYLDTRAGQLKSRLNASHVIDYYWVPAGVESYCPESGHLLGCAMGTEVFSEWVPHEHEIVHAAATDMPRVLNEGLATHWGDPWPIYEMAPRDFLYESLMGSGDLSGPAEYSRAAHFMAFLSETYGRGSLTELSIALNSDSSTNDISQAFIDLYARNLNEVLSDYQDYPDCDGIVDVSLACTGDAIAVGFGSPEIMREIDCSATQTIGPFDNMVFVEELIEVQPSISGSQALQVIGDGVERGGIVLLRRCGLCTENGVWSGNSLSFLDDDDLPPGRYLIRFYLPVGESPATLGLQISG